MKKSLLLFLILLTYIVIPIKSLADVQTSAKIKLGVGISCLIMTGLIGYSAKMEHDRIESSGASARSKAFGHGYNAITHLTSGSLFALSGLICIVLGIKEIIINK